MNVRIAFLLPALLALTGTAAVQEPGRTGPEAGAAPPTPRWLSQITRVAYTDLGNSRPGADWPEKVIPDLAAAGVQLFFSRAHSGEGWDGLAWKSAFGAADPRMEGRDDTRHVVELCHRHKIRYVAYYWAQREPMSLRAEHPEWRGIDAAGRTSQYFCVNTPYRDLVRNRIVELVATTGVDGIFFDMLHARRGECYCAGCTAAFRAQTGQAPPRTENPDDPLGRRWIDFRYRTLESAMLDFNRAIKAANPEAALIVNTWNAWVYHHALSARNSIRVIDAVDGILEETGWYDTVDPSFQAFPTLHNFMSWHLAGLAKDKPAFMWSRPTMVRLPIGYPEAFMRQMCMLANGAVPAQSVPGRDVMARYMADLGAREAYVRGSRPLRWCGLLVSEKTEFWYGRKEPQERYIQGIHGAFQILLERHLPAVLVTDRDLERGALDGLKVLVVPNAAALSQAECDALRRFVNAGGGLVATGETSMYDEEGQPLPDFRLGDLLNARKTGAFDARKIVVGWDPMRQHQADWVLPATSRWVRGDVRAALLRQDVTQPPGTQRSTLPFIGRLLTAEPLQGPAGGLRLSTAHYNGETRKVDRTSGAALIENRPGKGRVVYFPADLTWTYFRLGEPHVAGLVEQAIREAAGEAPPVEVAAPSIVQVAPFTQDGRLVVHLLNDISSLGRSQNVAGLSLRERTESIPIHGIALTFRDPRWRKFTLVPGGTPLAAEESPAGRVVRIPPLDVHAMVVAEE